MNREVEEVTDTDYVEETSEETTPETPAEETAETQEGESTTEVKQPDYKKMLIDTKRAFTKASMEKAEMAGRLSALEEQIRAMSSKETQENQKDWLEEVNFEELREDPNGLKKVIAMLRGDVANVLQARDNYFETRLKSVNPEINAFKDKIAEMKADPDFADFSDEQLVRLAKRETAKPKQSKASPEPASVGGGRRAASTGGGTDIRKSSLYRQIYGDLS